MDNKELQKIIDTKNGTISVLKDTVKKWVREYNMLDACIELQNEKIDAYKMSENEANEIIAELEAKNKIILDRLTDVKRLERENAKLKRENVMLLGQLVINDGEDVTVQISKSQFDEYNKFRTCLQVIKAMCEKHIRAEKIVMAQEVIDLITKAEEE